MKNTIRYFGLIVAVCALLMVAAFSAEAETEGIFTYAVNNGTATITKVQFSGQSEIVVPETINSFPVTAIGFQAMTDRTWELGDDTVSSFFIPKTVSNIQTDAFDFCDLAKIFVDAENPYYSNDVYGVLYNKEQTTLIKAPCCLQESSYTVPESVTQLEQSAFANCLNIQNLSLPNGLNTLGNQAFFEMDRLQSIALPEGITSIGLNDFAYCSSLESITLPFSLRSIAGSAFTECYALKEVIIPEGVTSIGMYAFESASALERIVLPSSLQSVGRAICGNCPNLAHVYYAGSAEDWAALNVTTGSYSGSRVDAFDVAAFHYNFDVTPYKTLKVDYDNDLLTISGTSSIPAADTDAFQFWDEHKDTVTALFLEGNIDQIGREAFSGFPNLVYVIFDTASTALSQDAFSACPLLETMLCFGDLALENACVDSDVDFLQIFVPASTTVSGNYDTSWYHVVPFSYVDNTLNLNGSVTWNSYQFLDTMTAFCLHYNPIHVLKCNDFTLDALPLYGTNQDGNYERIDENRLTDAELRAQINEAEDISFNELVQGIVDGSITNFRLVVKDSEHEEIKATPVEIKEENDSGIGDFIRKAIKWVVRIIDAFLNIISKFRR